VAALALLDLTDALPRKRDKDNPAMLFAIATLLVCAVIGDCDLPDDDDIDARLFAALTDSLDREVQAIKSELAAKS
jgi:hypothetical protein